MSARSRDRHIEAATVLDEAEVTRPHTTKDDDVALSTLEGVDCRDLDGLQSFISALEYHLVDELLLGFVSHDDPNREIRDVIRLTVVCIVHA